MKPPPGNFLHDIKPKQVLKLKKALYGLKQAGQQWYKTLINILTKMGMKQSEQDNTVFYKES